MNAIECKIGTLDLSTPLVMGILNATPDSFYHLDTDKESLIHKMHDEGVDIIDVGGQSSRPGAELINAEEELKRVLPVIRLIRKLYPDTPISIDTFYSKVVRKAFEEGICIVNDISGGEMDTEMFPVVAELNLPYILMHMRGTPQNMQNNLDYTNLIEEVTSFFRQKIERLNSIGVENIILDPGFGFGKSLDDNYILLNKLQDLQSLGLPILAGLSRKSMLYKSLEIKPQDALNATSIVNTIALLKGCDILRVHDVKEAREAVHLIGKLNQ